MHNFIIGGRFLDVKLPGNIVFTRSCLKLGLVAVTRLILDNFVQIDVGLTSRKRFPII